MEGYIDRQRSHRGFLTHAELIETIGADNVILDASSVLISRNIKVGRDNILYTNVVIEQREEGTISIGNGNIFYPGTYILSSAGQIYIGNENEFGPAGVTIKANMPDALIEIGDQGRYRDGANIMGKTSLGSGSQVLGSIAVQNSLLAGGGTYAEADPDKRAAVLKGFGLAREIILEVGEVISGKGDFSEVPIERQAFYHPKTADN